MATAPSPNELTRQQLDELDALLQRMLSQPFSTSDGSITPPPVPAADFSPPPLPPQREGPPPAAVPFIPPPRRVDPPSVPHLLAAPVSELPRQTVQQVVEPVPSTSSVGPIAASASYSPVPPPTVPFPRPSPPPAPAAADETVPLALPYEPVPLPLVPLVAFNQLVNRSLGLLGWPGRVLRSGFVKNLLGLIGIGLIVYTGLKIVSLHLALPFAIPWPR
jgi:hypothetical protein